MALSFLHIPTTESPPIIHPDTPKDAAMNRIPFTEPRRDCLVAVLRNDADLHRVIDERWYRIPDRVRGHQIAHDALDETSALAFYQTASIRTGLPGAIEVWGEIEERRVLPRRQIIPDEPYHPAADTAYHLIRLKHVERLERPVLSRRPRRITFIRTTRDRLLQAVDINDLIVGTRGEERLWASLRQHEPQIERRYYMRLGGMVMELDFALFRAGRGLGIICGESSVIGEEIGDVAEAWSVIRFSPARLDHDLDECLREIAAMAERMAGER